MRCAPSPRPTAMPHTRVPSPRRIARTPWRLAIRPWRLATAATPSVRTRFPSTFLPRQKELFQAIWNADKCPTSNRMSAYGTDNTTEAPSLARRCANFRKAPFDWERSDRIAPHMAYPPQHSNAWDRNRSSPKPYRRAAKPPIAGAIASRKDLQQERRHHPQSLARRRDRRLPQSDTIAPCIEPTEACTKRKNARPANFWLSSGKRGQWLCEDLTRLRHLCPIHPETLPEGTMEKRPSPESEPRTFQESQTARQRHGGFVSGKAEKKAPNRKISILPAQMKARSHAAHAPHATQSRF